MRILQVVGGLDRGGAETWLVQVLRHIDRQKYQFDFLVHGTQHYAYEDEVVALGSRVIRCLSPGNPLKYALNFRRVLREYGPYDCAHSHVHHFTGYVMLLSKVAGVPIRIAHSHTAHIEKNVSFRRRAYLRTMDRLVKRFSTQGVAVSAAAGDSLFPANWRDNPKWKVSPLGIDLTPFAQPVDSVALRHELGIPEGAFVVGHVGRFVEAKNHVFLVDIAAELLKLKPEAFFMLVGDGPLRPSIEAKVDALGIRNRFLFTGVRTDVPALMKGAMDVFLFPSLYEGLGLVLVEAQVAGLRCVTSENIPPEAKVLPEMMSAKSLHDDPQAWATSLLLTLRNSKRCTGSFLRIPSVSQSAVEMLARYGESPRHFCR